MAAGLGRLVNDGRGMERIGLVLKASGSCFAVESARTAECTQAFAAFVQELRAVADQVTAVAEAMAEDASRARAEQTRAIEVVGRRLEELGRLATASERALQAATFEVREIVDAAFVALGEADAHSRQIARHADEVVYYLQFGDIVRQKCEHIIAAAAGAQERLRELINAAAEVPQLAWQIAAVDQILAVQVAQLESVRDEVRTAQTQIEAAFLGLGRETSGLSSCVGRINATDRSGRAQAGAFDRLKACLNHLQQLRADGQALSQQARETSRTAVEVCGRLSAHVHQVRQINRKLHLQALNATVKTCHLGAEGRTLEVLSQQVHLLFQDTEQIVTTTVPIIESITTDAAGLVADGDAANPCNQPEARDVSLQLSDLDAEFRRVSTTALTLANEQQAILSQTQQQLGLLTKLADRLGESIQTLAGIRQGLAPWMADDPVSAETEPLAARYTMESEREIHRRVLAGASGLGAVPAPVAASQSAMIADESGVEFFDLPPGGSTPAQAAEAPKHIALTQVAVAPADGWKGGTPAQKEAKAANPTDLGENVELF